MNQIVSLNIVTTLTMSSREIATLTGKLHRNVMRDATNMLVELHGLEVALKFEHYYIASNGKRNPELLLPKRETFILVSGYSVELRARIIDRWMELEEQQAKTQVVPITAPKKISTAFLSPIKGLAPTHSPVIMLLKIFNFVLLTLRPCRSLRASFWPERIASISLMDPQDVFSDRRFRPPHRSR